MTRRTVLTAIVAVGVGVGALPGMAQVITRLTLPERANVDRLNEPVRMGIPLGRGVVSDLGALRLQTEGGATVPAQFKEVMRWPEDDSLRWVLVNFQATVKAGDTGAVLLAKGDAAVGKALQVSREGETVTVNTGVLKIRFKGQTLVDAAWHDPQGQFGPDTQIIGPHQDGLIAKINGRRMTPGDDSTVTIEEQGPEAVVVKIAGTLQSGDQAPFAYVVYAHCFRSSPVVRLDVAYTCVHGRKATDFVTLEDWSLVLPTTLGQGSARIGGEDSVLSGKRARIMARTSDLSALETDGKPAGKAGGKSTKPDRIGWVAYAGERQGLAMGVRWFWQMFPKTMEAMPDGTLRAGLYAGDAGAPLDVYMGQGRTHYITLLFGKQSDDRLSDFFAATQTPLRALATPKYYCRESEGFGKIADSDPAIYTPDVLEKMQAFDACLLNSAQAIEKKIDGHTYNRVTVDSYGYYPWGDLFHYANTPGVTDKWNILWESNYYDFPWACGLQFARTGDMLYLDILDRNGLHLADVFMCKYAPEPKYRGACRYSPPANHVGLDRNYKTPKPYFSVEFNHHKAQSILARYYLLGDLRARDDFMLALNNAMTNPEASWRQSRGPGAKLATLYSGYILTRDPECLAKMKTCMEGAWKLKDNVKGFSRQGPSGYFMMGVATEGMYYYWLLTGDRNTLETIQNVTDFQLGEGRSKSVANSACAAAFVYRQTGDEAYKKGALGFLKAKQEHRPKNFAQHWRSAPYAWYYLSKLGAGE